MPFIFETEKPKQRFVFEEPKTKDPRRFGIPEGAGEPISTVTGKPLLTDFGRPREKDKGPEAPTWGKILKQTPASGLAHVNVGLARLAKDTIKLADLPASTVRKALGIKGERPGVKFLENYILGQQKRQEGLDLSEELGKLPWYHPKRIAGTGLVAIPQVATVAGGALMGGPVIGGTKAASIMLGAIAYGPSAEEAKAEGANEIQQVLHGITAAEIEVLTELPVFGAVGRLWKHLKGAGIAKKAGLTFIKKVLTGLGLYGKGMALETVQEIEAYLGGQASKRLIYDPNATITLKGIKDAGYGGGSMSAVIGLLGLPAIGVRAAVKPKTLPGIETTEPGQKSAEDRNIINMINEGMTTGEIKSKGRTLPFTLETASAVIQQAYANKVLTREDLNNLKENHPDLHPVINDIIGKDIASNIDEEFKTAEREKIEAEEAYRKTPEYRQEIIDAEMLAPAEPKAEIAPEDVELKKRQEMTLNEFVEETRKFHIEEGMSPEEVKKTITRDTERDSHKRRLLYAFEHGEKIPYETLKEYADDKRFAEAIKEVEPTKETKPVKAYTGDVKFIGMQHAEGMPSIPIVVTPESGQVDYDPSKHKITNKAEYDKAVGIVPAKPTTPKPASPKPSEAVTEELKGEGIAETIFPKTYEEVEPYIKAKAKKYGSQNKYFASDEYKKDYPKIYELTTAHEKDLAKKADKLLKERALSPSDTVEYVTPDGSGAKRGNLYLDKKGIPKVKVHTETGIQGEAAVNRTETWNTGWKKVETIVEPSAKPETPIIKGNKTTVYLPDNTEVDLEYGLAEINDLVTSHDLDMAVNPVFPAEYQPRDRSRKAMKQQVTKIANVFNPARVGVSTGVASGAPVVTKDFVVLSGNGRTIALKKVYTASKGENYKQWLSDNAKTFGFTKKQVEKLETPVLVRIRKASEGKLDFVRKSAEDETARMSPVEIAKFDADRLTEGDVAIFSPSRDGNIASASNHEFINKFIQGLGTNESTGFLTEEGRYTKQLIDRITAAIFYKAYQSDRLISLMAEDADTNIKNILKALTVAAPEYAKTRMLSETMGDTAVVEHIVGATKIIIKTRDLGQTVDQFFKQMTMFEQVPGLTKQIALFIDQHKLSAKRQGEFFKDIAKQINDVLMENKNIALPGMTQRGIDLDRVIDKAIQQVEEKYGNKQQGLFGEDSKESDKKGERVGRGRTEAGMAETGRGGVSKAGTEGVKDGDIEPKLFSTKATYEKDLIAYHNTTEAELLEALESGGLAMPSIAITRKDIPYEKYGPITLIGRKETIDPTGDRINRVFDSDIYSPRVPGKKWKVNQKQVFEVYDRFASIMDEMNEDKYFFEEAMKKGKNKLIDYADQSISLKVAFLREQGIPIQIPKRQIDFHVPLSENKDIQNYLENLDYNLDRIEYKSKEHKQFSKVIKEAVTKEYQGKEDGKFIADTMLESYFGKDGFLDFGWMSGFERDQEILKGKSTEIDKYKLEDRLKNKFTKKLSEQYLDWINKAVGTVYSEPYIVLGRKKVPYTLDNIVRAMKREGLKGEEKTLTFGPAKARAKAAKEIPSIAAMHKLKGRLVTKEKVQEAIKVQEEIGDKFTKEIINHYRYNDWRGKTDTWGALDNAMKAIGAFLSGKVRTIGNMQDVLNRYGFDNVPDLLAREAIKFSEVLMGTPTQYFEFKSPRAVGFSEFEGIVIPTNSSLKLRRALKEAGLKIRTYKEYDSVGREKAVASFHKRKDVLFTTKGGKPQDIIPEAEIRDTILRDVLSQLDSQAIIDYSRIAFGKPTKYYIESGSNLGRHNYVFKTFAEGLQWARKHGFKIDVFKDGFGIQKARLTHKKTEALLEKQTGTLKQAWDLGKDVYVRYGSMPESGRSFDNTTGTFEKGVSVFRGRLLPDGKALAQPETHVDDATQKVLSVSGRKIYIIMGDEVGTGADGEPLIGNAKQLTPKQAVKIMFNKNEIATYKKEQQTKFKHSMQPPAKPQDTITRKDLKEIFSNMKNVMTGQDKEGNFFFKTIGRPKITIYEVNHIGGYIGTSSGRIAVGSFLKNKIELKTGGEGVTADVSTLFHEFTHFLEKNNIINGNDIKSLNQAIAKERGILSSRITEEHRAEYVGDNLAVWTSQKNLRIKRILKKIADFMNTIYEFVARTRVGQKLGMEGRTARGVLRGIETGELLGKTGISAPAKGMIPAYQQTAERFYSQVIKTVQDKMPDKMQASAVMNWLRKQPGIKPAELEWMDVEAMLEGKKVVAKDELVRLLKENEVVVEEVVKKGGEELQQEDIQEDINAWAVVVGDAWENASYYISETEALEAQKEIEEELENEEIYDQKVIITEVGLDETDIAIDELPQELLDKYGDTKFSEWQLPGEKENYRELLFKIPNSKFISQHWPDDLGTFAHVRINERTDTDGNRVLFVEESQPEWAKALMDEFDTFKKEKYPQIAKMEKSKERTKLEQKAKSEFVDLKKSNKYGKVPFMPLWDNAQEVIWKRIIRMAAEQGFDKVSWITGEQTADRYNLSKKVDSIIWNQRRGAKTGVKTVTIQPKGETPIMFDILPDGTVSETGFRINEQWAGRNIEAVVGKDIGKKIIEESTGEFSGLDLKVGAEWAYALYDRMIPQYLKKFGKKFGAKTGTIKIDTGKKLRLFKDGQKWKVIEEGKSGTDIPSEQVGKFKTREEAQAFMDRHHLKETQPSFTITPELKRSALFEGMPLFQMAGEKAIGGRKHRYSQQGLSKQKGSTLDNEGMELLYTVYVNRHYGESTELISDKTYCDNVGLNLESDTLKGLKDEITRSKAGEERKQFATKPTVDYKEMLRWYQEEHTTPLVDELIERTQSNFDPVNSTPEETKAFKKSVRFLPKRFRSEVLSVKDMEWYHKALETPYVLAKKFASMGRAVKTEIKRLESRTKKLFDYYHGELADFQKHVQKNKEDLNAFTDLTWEYENRRFPEKDVPTDWFSVVEDKEADNYGDLQINPEHYDEVKKYLVKQGIKPVVTDGFVTIRKTLDSVLVEADSIMRGSNIDQTDLEEFRSFIGKTHNYFPHIREGNSYIKITNRNTKKTVYREHFWSLKERALPERKMAKARTAKWLNDQLASGKLAGKKTDYIISPAQKVTQLPDEIFFQIPVEALSQITGEAGKGLSAAKVGYEAKRLMKNEGLSEKEAHDKAYNILTADIERHLAKAMADVLKTRGWGKHSIQRQNIPGFKKTDVFETLSGYLTGYAGFATKIQAAKEHSKTLRSMDARKTPKTYQYTSDYIRDMLANADKTDKMVDRLRGLFFVKYLGGVVKSGIVNLTQNAVMAGPILSQHTKFSHTKLAKAMKDVRESITGKNAWMGKETEYTTLLKNEQQALTEMVETGAAQDLYLRELKGDIPGKGWGKYVRKIMDKTGVFMMVAEKFNRASTGLAAYRVAMNEGALYDDTQTKGNHNLSVRFAKKVIYDSHFLYGKSNLPASFRGGDFRKVARAAYTFRSFTHNYLDIMVDLMANQGTQGLKVAGRSMMNIMMVGGLTSIPFFKALSEVIKWAQDDDDEDMLTEIRSKMSNKFMQDMVVYGLSGAVGGFDLSGSLSIEVPRNLKEIIGVPYSMYEDSINMTRSVKAGNAYRAVSETPFTPIVMRNAMRGIELYTKGQRTRGGKAINVPGKKEPRKITGVEAIKKTALGLQPIEVSSGYKAYRAAGKMKAAISEKKRDWADKIANATIKRDLKKVKEIKQKIQEWNRQARKDRKLWRVVNINEMVKNRLHGKGLKGFPVKMREEAKKRYKVWE